MTDPILPRKLWYTDAGERQSVDESFLWIDTRSLVVLGEAGMGKSTLLRRLQQPYFHQAGYRWCSARALINAADAASRFDGAQTLVIDGLDEVTVQKDGDAVDLVVRRLGELGYPRFVLACRVADWRSATGLQGLADLYDARPLELHLEPLERDEAARFLEARLGAGRGEATVGHLEAQSLAGLWSNPQTLALVGEVAAAEALPASKGGLFDAATRLLQREHREEKARDRLVTLSPERVIEAAGAAFATLILSGKEAVTTRASVEPDDLALSEIATLPDADAIGDILGSRLFSAVEPDRFTYTHRAVGEFLGARWLAARADTPRRRRRLLSLFHQEGLVPVSLRGLHAWLAWHSPDLAASVIAIDPMGVVQYGDTARLTLAQAHGLLDAVEVVAADKPHFMGWDTYRLGGLAQPALSPRFRSILTSADAGYGMKRFVLQALDGSPLVGQLHDVLTDLLLDPDQVFSTRSDAGELLARGDLTVNWPSLVDTLADQGDENGVRLALELMNEVGYAPFHDALVEKVVLAQLERTDRTVGVFFVFERRFPTERADPLLTALALAAGRLKRGARHSAHDAISDLVYGLLARRLEHGPVTPAQVAAWLAPFGRHYAGHREAREQVAAHFRNSSALRRAVQRHVLIDAGGEDTVWGRSWRLRDQSPGLSPDEADLLILMEVLKSDDPRWRDLVQMAVHGDGRGAAVREAARRFAGEDPAALDWLEGLTRPIKDPFEVQQEQRRRRETAKREKEWAKHRREFGARIADLRAGEYSLILNPARAYLKLFSDMGDETADGPGRLQEWLGEDLRDAALEGFEAFLQRRPARPTAADISTAYAQSKRWEAAQILVAAFAERSRVGRGFDDVDTERLMAGFFELRHTRVDDHAGVPDLYTALEEALRARGAWEEAQRLYTEPQFEAGKSHIDGLYRLMREARDETLASQLALDWLVRFPVIAGEAEAELVDHLLVTPAAWGDLGAIAGSRQERDDLDASRRRTWEAAGLIIDFAATAQRLDAAGDIDPDLLWSVRARLGGRREDGPGVKLGADQLAWLIGRFRSLFRDGERPSGVTSGDTNPWDASEFIHALIKRLGADLSEAAVAHLAALRDAPEDDYTDQLRTVSAEQKRQGVEARWRAPTFETVQSVVQDAPPTTSRQLQQVVLQELETVQAKLVGSDVDYYGDFIENGRPHGEERCRDALIKMLRPLPFGIQADPERHLADDKRADIVCQLGELIVPIEIKGQWHRDLWTAADRQLDRLYVNDWRAEAGIYVVLWFGTTASKRLTRPAGPAPSPGSADELRSALAAQSDKAGAGRVEVVVLDFERPA